MKELPKKNDVLLIKFGYGYVLWYVHCRTKNRVLAGCKGWDIDRFLWCNLRELNTRNAEKVGRCIRIWPFKFFILDEK